jgi:hypothetical protein
MPANDRTFFVYDDYTYQQTQHMVTVCKKRLILP